MNTPTRAIVREFAARGGALPRRQSRGCDPRAPPRLSATLIDVTVSEMPARRILQALDRICAQRLILVSLNVAAALSAGGCAATLMPTPLILLPPASQPWVSIPAQLQTPYAEVLYATDRERKPGDGPPRYEYGRSASLAFGTARVRWGDAATWSALCEACRDSNRFLGLLSRVDSVEEAGCLPETPWKTQELPGGGVALAEGVREEHDRQIAAFQMLVADRLAYTPRKEAFVYVHGFNNRFEDAVPVIAELWHFLGRVGVPIAYCWPTRSGLDLHYNYDRESGEFTIFHLKQFLEALAATPGLERVHLIAHSRGADVLCTALRELNIKYRAKFPDDDDAPARALRIHHLVLAAPDIDLSVARQRIEAERIRRICRRLTVYTSADDRAINFVRWLFSSTVRIGSLGFASLPPDTRNDLARLEGVELIQSRVSAGFIGHEYFYSNSSVSSDLILLLRDDRKAGAEHGRPLRHIDGAFWEVEDGYPNDEREK